MKTKTIFIAICSLCLFSLNCYAQVPSWQWAKSAGGTGYDYNKSIATDASGNVYVTGSFYSPSITFGTITLTNVNNAIDIFIVKYDASGNVLWARSAGGSGNDSGFDIYPDASGNVYVTGYFKSSSITFGTTVLTNVGSNDVFIVKYDASGNVLWAKSAGGTDSDSGENIFTDVSGNVYVTGDFKSSSITFGAHTLTNTGTAGSGEMFIIKYDVSGNALWAKSAGIGTYHGISTDANGNIYVTGSFYGASVTFGLTNAGVADIFVVKYDTSGNVLWAKSAGGTGSDFGRSILAETNGNILITGYFNSSTLTFGTTTLTSAGSDDIFIVKYDASGNVLWAKSAGGTDEDRCYGISTDMAGNMYVTGDFKSSFITFGTTTLTNAGATGSNDIFITKYDASGNMLWVKSVGGTSYDHGMDISIDAGGNVYVTGYFSSASIAFGTTTLTNAGSYDIFVAKLDSSSVTGINEFMNEDLGIRIFPNPSHGKFQMEINSIVNNLELEIYNVMGEKVYVELIPASFTSSRIDISNQPSGIYFLNLKTEKDSFTQKLIIQK